MQQRRFYDFFGGSKQECFLVYGMMDKEESGDSLLLTSTSCISNTTSKDPGTEEESKQKEASQAVTSYDMPFLSSSYGYITYDVLLSKTFDTSLLVVHTLIADVGDEDNELSEVVLDVEQVES